MNELTCGKCGAKPREGAAFCHECGAAQSLTQQGASEAAIRGGSGRTWVWWACGAGLLILVAIVATTVIVRRPTSVSHPSTQSQSQVPTLALAATSDPATIAAAVDQSSAVSSGAITTPQPGSKDRAAMMNAIRAYAKSPSLVFIVEKLYVQGDAALAQVHPTKQTDDGKFGDKWCGLRREPGGSWKCHDATDPFEENLSVREAATWWPWASRELIARFLGLSVDGSVASAVRSTGQASRTGTLRRLQDLSSADMKVGAEFLLQPKLMGSVTDAKSYNARQLIGNMEKLRDGTYVYISSNAIAEADYSDGDTLILRINVATHEAAPSEFGGGGHWSLETMILGVQRH